MPLQAYYYDEKSLLSNEEFDNLKEDLIWAGSKVAVLRYDAPLQMTRAFLILCLDTTSSLLVTDC